MANVQKLIIYAILAALVLVSEIVCQPTVPDHSMFPGCELLEKDPLSGPNKPKAALLEPWDRSALVSFLGDLEYSNITGKTFLPFVAKQMYVDRTYDEGLVRSFTVVGDCARMVFNMETGMGLYSVATIDVELLVANKGIKSCQIREPWILFPSNNYFNCPSGFYDCMTKDNSGKDIHVAFLNVGELSIELERKQNAQDGQFSQPPLGC